MKKPILVMLLCCSLAFAGCSAAWITTLDDILTAAAPALINILNIISIAKAEPLNTTLAGRITQDAANIKTFAGDLAVASAAAAPTACAQLQAGIQAYSQDQAQVMSVAQVSNQATQAKITTLAALVLGTVVAMLALVPNCQQVVTMRASLESKAVPLPLRSFIKSYNANLTVKTGVAAVDSYTHGHKVHSHSLLVRTVTFGYAQ